MRFELICCVILLTVAAAFAQKPAPSKADEKNDNRFFFTSLSLTTFTIYKKTTTTTSTFISTATCTTSTAALTTCTAGRRRRGLFYTDGPSKRAHKGLFGKDDDFESDIFLNKVVKRSNDPVDEVKPVEKKDENIIPLEIQSGFNAPDVVKNNRFLLAFGTSTVTSLTVSTTTSTLTAVCSSTTGFPTCSSGK